MRKLYIDNIRWITVVLVVLYHVIYMFNGIETFGVIGPFSDVQYQDAFQYIVYPWFMLLLFVISGMSARYELEHRSEKEFIKKRTGKLLVPSTLGLLVFWWILGYYNLLIGGGLEQMAAVPKQVLFIIMAVSGIGRAMVYPDVMVFFCTAHMGSQSGKRQIVEAGRESKRSISCAVCNCDLGRSSDFKHTNDCGISLWYLWGWIFCGIFCFVP